jgi:hypothetical protein
MRSVLALGRFTTLCATANAATLHRASSREDRFRTLQSMTVRPSEGDTSSPRFAVPGWTDEATRRIRNQA